MRRRASFISAPVALQPLVQDDERARIDVDGHPERLGHAVSGNVVMGRPDTAGGEDIDVARPKRLKRIDDRPLLVTDHPHFLEIDPERGQIFRDIADVLILGAAGQDSVADHHEGGDLFRSGCVGGCHHRLVVRDRRRSKPQLPPLSALTLPWVTLCLHGKS
jgi:hypothetical protein